jgi:tRNA(Ile)-lysidine synthase
VEHARARLLEVLQRSIKRYAMLEAGERVLVAVSGGPDSIGLLLLLGDLRRKLGIELVAAHVNHRLRGAESEADERCAAAAAERLGVAWDRAGLPAGLASGGNLEARLRDLRYAALHRLAERHGCRKIATGHTRDDQAETFLLRLARGAGSSGLAGIEPRRGDGVVRPLIDCTRAQVEDVVRRAGVAYRVDRMNHDPRFQRTLVRDRVLPALAELNPSVRRALANAAALLRTERALLARALAAELARVVRDGRLRLPALAQVEADLAPHLVRRWLAERGVPERNLSSRRVDGVLALASGRGRGDAAVALPAGWRVRREGDDLVVSDRPEHATAYAAQALAPDREVDLPGGWRLVAREVARRERRPPLPDDLWSALCAADGTASSLVVRPARRGERVRPLGLNGQRKLSDVFTDRKIPSAVRWCYPVVESGGEIVWVPGVVRSEVRAMTPRTRRVLWLHALEHP